MLTYSYIYKHNYDSFYLSVSIYYLLLIIYMYVTILLSVDYFCICMVF